MLLEEGLLWKEGAYMVARKLGSFKEHNGMPFTSQRGCGVGPSWSTPDDEDLGMGWSRGLWE